MSGTSRIGGHGGYFGGERREGRSASLARFCRGRKEGDIVSGVFLRSETETLGWALLEGEELLATLPADGPRPTEGARVHFRIEALSPEVVLRMLSGDAVETRLAMIVPSLPLSQEGALYTVARDRLDALLQAVYPTSPYLADCAGRKKAFAALVAANPALLAAFAETTARSRALEKAASKAGLVFFRHMPWVSRAVSGVEVSFWEKGESPVLAGATLPSGDRAVLRGAFDGGVLRYRVRVVPAAGGMAAASLPQGLFPARTERAIYAGGDRPGSHGGTGSAGNTGDADVVGRILALAASGVPVGRFSRKL